MKPEMCTGENRKGFYELFSTLPGVMKIQLNYRFVINKCDGSPAPGFHNNVLSNTNNKKISHYNKTTYLLTLIWYNLSLILCNIKKLSDNFIPTFCFTSGDYRALVWLRSQLFPAL